MEIGFTTVTFRKKSPEKIVAIALKNDIKNIEWGGDVHLPPCDIDKAKSLKALTDKCGINNFSYGSYYRVGENDLDKFDKICAIAHIIGAQTVRIWLGNKSSKETSESESERYVQEIRALCDIAQGYDLVVASEFHNNTFNDNGKGAVEFIQRVGKDNLMTMWQPFGDDQIDIENLIATMPYLREIHVFNWLGNCRKPLAQGKKKWTDFLDICNKYCQALPTKNKDIICVLEFVKGDSARAFKKDAQTLKEWLANL
ncbi:MAG: TIM barrel protein [Clostridia bacterium]